MVKIEGYTVGRGRSTMVYKWSCIAQEVMW